MGGRTVEETHVELSLGAAPSGVRIGAGDAGVTCASSAVRPDR